MYPAGGNRGAYPNGVVTTTGTRTNTIAAAAAKGWKLRVKGTRGYR